MYKLLDGSVVLRTTDGVFIPNDPGNVDRRAYDLWTASGNIAERVTPETLKLPASISRFQAKAVLLRHDLLDEVEAYATAPNTDPIVKLAWDEAVEVKRSSLMVMNIAILLDLSQSQLDNLFAEAATIEV